jgi:hypothetical protein
MVILSGCNITRTQQYNIEVKRGNTIEEKKAFAQAFVTNERFAKLKEQIKKQIPSVTDEQLLNLGLRWNVTNYHSLTGGGSGTIVTISVLMQIGEGYDAQAIVNTAVKIIESEINPPADRTDQPKRTT